MSSPYNLTNISSGGSNPAGLIQGLDQASGGLLGIAIMLTFFVITLLTMLQRRNALDDSISASSFTTFIITFLLWLLEVVQELALYISLGLLVMGFVLQARGRR